MQEHLPFVFVAQQQQINIFACRLWRQNANSRLEEGRQWKEMIS